LPIFPKKYVGFYDGDVSRIGREGILDERVGLCFHRFPNGTVHALVRGMNTSSISTSLNGFSPSYLQQMLSHELTSNTLTKPTSQSNGSTAATSSFSQMMSELNTASSLGTANAAQSNGSGGFFQQMMSLF
jgi:hypothetical protein